jgi:hypothetical protein
VYIMIYNMPPYRFANSLVIKVSSLLSDRVSMIFDRVIA